jgi:hypothetical protein
MRCAWLLIAAAVVAGCGAQPPRTAGPDPGRIDVGGHTGPVALADGALWVAVYRGRAHHSVVRIDTATNRIAARVPVEGGPFEIAAGDGAVWVTGNFDSGGDVLHRIDPRSNRVAATIDLPGDYAGPLATGAGAVWQVVTDRGRTHSSLVRIDPAGNEVSGTFALEAANDRYVDELAVGHGSVWALALKLGAIGELPGDVVRVDPTGVDPPVVIEAEALNMGVGTGGVWVTGCLECGRHRKRFFGQEIDIEANVPTGPRVPFERGAGPLSVGPDSVWFAGYDSQGGTAAHRLDPDTGTVDRSVSAGAFLHTGVAIDAGERTLWVAGGPGFVARVDLAGG